MTLQECWAEEFEPLCADIMERMRRASLPQNERAGLQLLAASYLFGSAVAAATEVATDGASGSLIAKQIAGVLVEGVFKTEMN